MIYLKLEKKRISKTADKAIGVLRTGGIIAYPTETFYGLGAKFDLPDSLQKLYGLKKRPKEKAMPLIIGDKGLLRMIVPGKWLDNIPAVVRSLIGRFWPGPLTLLFPAKEGLSEYLSADTGKVAVRVPGGSFALHLARIAGFPITATSANLSGKPPAARADDLIKYFDEGIDLVVDGGATTGGLPSTIIDVTGSDLEIVREGIISRNEIERFVENMREKS